MRLEHLWLAMTEALHTAEVVHITVPDERRREHLEQQIAYYGFEPGNIDIHIVATDDVWSRDNGPIFVVNHNGEAAVTDWNFNGWGGRYTFSKDRTVPGIIAELLGMQIFTGPIVLEGGGIEVNGKGTLMATRTSIINSNRNPGKSQEEIEAAIKGYLGVKHIIWLSGAPREFCDRVGSDTDFHIDGAARFVDDSTVLYSWTDDEHNPYYPFLVQHRKELQSALTESGRPLTLIPLPAPRGGFYSTLNTTTTPPFQSKRAVSTYTNYYIGNGAVLVPVYGNANDAAAKTIIAEHFPGRDVVAIPALAVAELGGMMHCVTQQQPAT
jgi:agmatine deiminase